MEILIIFLPFVSFLFTAVFNDNWNIKLANYIPTSIMIVCCFYSFYLFFKIFILNETFNFHIYSWITSGNFNSKWSFNFDILTSVMMIVVTTISLIVHIYCIKYIENKSLKFRVKDLLHINNRIKKIKGNTALSTRLLCQSLL